MKALNLQNQIFGRLTVISKAPNKSGKTQWHCLCSCGNNITISTGHLRSGKTSSCGCLFTELLIKRNTSHNLSYSKEYRIWNGMKSRCDNPKTISYPFYGGRGITVCSEWSDSFQSFLDDMGLCPSDNHSIERINSKLNYTPLNCKWATKIEQANNQSNNHLITIDGVTNTVANWCKITGVPKNIVYTRLTRNNWPGHLAITCLKGTRLKTAMKDYSL